MARLSVAVIQGPRRRVALQAGPPVRDCVPIRVPPDAVKLEPSDRFGQDL